MEIMMSKISMQLKTPLESENRTEIDFLILTNIAIDIEEMYERECLIYKLNIRNYCGMNSNRVNIRNN
jgi:hypothetical protein